MPDVLHIDGLDLNAKDIAIDAGTTTWDALRDLGATVRVEHLPAEEAERTITAEAASFIADYEREEADSVLAVFWRYHSLEAEEFDTVEEAKRFLESSEEYESLAGEAVVDATGRVEVLD
jgi:hypothetical protein